LTLFAATVLVDMSSTNGGLRRAGAANAIGLVVRRGSAPPVGTTLTTFADVVTRPISPASAAIAA